MVGEFGEIVGDFVDDVGDEGVVGFGEDVGFVVGEEDVGEGFVDGVGDFVEVEVFVIGWGGEDGFGDEGEVGCDEVVLGEVGFLVFGGVDGVFECEIGGDSVIY